MGLPFLFATYAFVSLEPVNGSFVCVLGCICFEVNKADGEVWISFICFVIGIGEFVVLGVVVLVVSVVTVICSSVFLNVISVGVVVVVVIFVGVVGFVVVESGIYT